MAKTGRNDPCPCGSDKKFKNCCLKKKPRERIVMVGSAEPLRGLHYDKEKMEFMGLTHDGRLIETEMTFSQTQYTSQSGKEKVIIRVQDKVIPDEADLMRYLSSSFDLIIGIDTNTRVIGGETVSVTGVVYCIVQAEADHTSYNVDFPWHGAILFRDCPTVLPPEKFGWRAMIKEFIRKPINKTKRIAIVTDHDLENHISYNSNKIPIFGDFCLPENMILIYGRADGPTQNLLNYLVKQCDKKSSDVLKELETTGNYKHGDMRIPINKIPVPGL